MEHRAKGEVINEAKPERRTIEHLAQEIEGKLNAVDAESTATEEAPAAEQQQEREPGDDADESDSTTEADFQEMLAKLPGMGAVGEVANFRAKVGEQYEKSW